MSKQVFATKFLEKLEIKSNSKIENWSWAPPENAEVRNIHASGRPTTSTQSTYAKDTDTIQDKDRPNEGLMVA